MSRILGSLAVLLVAVFLASELRARPEASAAVAGGPALELRRASSHPGAAMSGGGLALRGVAGQHDTARLTAADGSAVDGGFLPNGAVVFSDGFETGGLSAWSSAVGAN